jgi:hypothetical protein
MIISITKKELTRVKTMRKHMADYEKGRLYFIADDQKAYMCDQSGFKGAKEIADFNKQIKANLTQQTELI